MAIESIVRILSDGPRRAVVQLVASGDADEMCVLKVDVSQLEGRNGDPCLAVKVVKANYDVRNTSLRLDWEGTPPSVIFNASTPGKVDHRADGGLGNDALLPTGNILASTYDSNGDVTGWSYTMRLELLKKYKLPSMPQDPDE